MDRFDLEQAIMACWSTKEDIRLISENIMEKNLSEDEIANSLIGIEAIHDMRVQKVFDIFEELLRTRKLV
jgi:hypothetical protein